MGTKNSLNSLHKAAVSDLESKLRLKEAETSRLDSELENAKNILSNKIKEIRESAKIVKEVDLIKEENVQLLSLTEELKTKTDELNTKNIDLNQELETEKKKKKQIELRNSRLETLLNKKNKLASSSKSSSCSVVKSVLYAVEHALVLSCISYAVYYKYVIEPEQERMAKS